MRKLQLQDVPGEPMPVLPELTEEDVAAINMQDLQFELKEIDENLAKTKPNMAAINEFNKKEEVRSGSYSCQFFPNTKFSILGLPGESRRAGQHHQVQGSGPKCSR